MSIFTPIGTLLIVEETLPGPSDRLLTIFAHADNEWRDVLAVHCTGEYTKELHLPADFAHLTGETWYTGQELQSLLESAIIRQT